MLITSTIFNVRCPICITDPYKTVGREFISRLLVSVKLIPYRIISHLAIWFCLFLSLQTTLIHDVCTGNSPVISSYKTAECDVSAKNVSAKNVSAHNVSAQNVSAQNVSAMCCWLSG